MYHPNLFGKEHMIMIGTNVTGHEEEEEVRRGQTFMWGYGWLSSSSEDNFISPQEQPLFEQQTLDIINADESEEDVRSQQQQQQQQQQQLENDHTSSEGQTNFGSLVNNESSRQIILPKGISACLHRHESLPPPQQQQQQQQQSQVTSSKYILHYYATLWIILLLPIPLVEYIYMIIPLCK
jgi:hypothetical protein